MWQPARAQHCNPTILNKKMPLSYAASFSEDLGPSFSAATGLQPTNSCMFTVTLLGT